MELAALVIAAAAFIWSVGWGVFEYRARRAGDQASSVVAEDAVAEARRAADAAERSAAAAEVASRIELERADAALVADVRILFWESRQGTDTGPGLVVHNIGLATAHDLIGCRLMPTGAFEESRALKTLNPGERRGIHPGWESRHAPADTPRPHAERYTARVEWTDGTGTRRTDWQEVEKR